MRRKHKNERRERKTKRREKTVIKYRQWMKLDKRYMRILATFP